MADESSTDRSEVDPEVEERIEQPASVEAEEEARKLLSEAEDQARATREAAQEMANQIEEDVRRRHESLAREAKSLEERRQRVLDGLRDLAAQLQDALVEPTSRDMDQSLADALDVERRR